MHSTLAVAAAFAGAAAALSPYVAPKEAAPAGYVSTYASPFQITAVKASGSAASKRDISKRDACPTGEGALVITLENGVLTDGHGRIADIVSNHQFQFDPPPGQAGYIYNAGYSVGSNSSIALGDSTIFYECKSGGFYNLYTTAIADYCIPININIIPCGAATSDAVSQAADGQATATSAVSAATDGQPQASSAITAATDGQPQASSASVVSEFTDGQPQASSAVAISEFTDGQPQATLATMIPITQISDGQVQVPTAVISQISDGQVQAPTTLVLSTGIPISQISDGQVQAPTASASWTASSNGTGLATAKPTPSVVTTNSGNNLAIGSSMVAVVAAFFVALL